MARKKFVKKYIAKALKDSGEPDITTPLPNLFSQYNDLNFAPKKFKEWIIEYVIDNEMDYNLKKIDEKHFISTSAILARIIKRGYVPTEKNIEYLNNSIDAISKKVEDEPRAVEENTSKKTIQDKIREQVLILNSEIDFYLDEYVTTKKENSLRDILREYNVGAIQANKMMDHVQSYINEFELVKTDEEFAEGYSNFSKVGINKIIKYMKYLFNELQSWIEAKKKTRKIRTKKNKTPAQLSEKVKLSPESKIRPEKLIGSKYALFYNIKLKLYMLFSSIDGDGFTTKGTTLLNVNEEKSKGYRLTLSAFRSNKYNDISQYTKITELKKILVSPDFKENKVKPKTRINKDMVIINVY